MERMLVTKIVLNRDGNVELFARGHKFRDTLLFDVSDLMEVGIDPNELEVGQELAVRFWALYELSDRTNKSGNPYKDILALEPTDKPATSTSVDQSAVLEELRAIRVLLQRLVGETPPAQEPQEPGTAETGTAPAAPPPTDDATEHNFEVPWPTERAPAPARPEPDPHSSMDDGEARLAFYDLAGDAVKAGQIDPAKVNALQKTSKDTGWLAALRTLDTWLHSVQDGALSTQNGVPR